MADDPKMPAAEADQGQRPDVSPEPPAAEPEVVDNPEAKAASEEAKKYRLQVRELEKEIKAFKEAEEKRQDAELSEIDRLKKETAKLEPLQAQIDAMSEVIQQVLDRELESVPEDRRDQIQGQTPVDKLADITRLKRLGLFAAKQQPTPPNFNAGEQSVVPGAAGVQLSDQELSIAKMMNLTPAEYAEQKKKMSGV